MTARALLLCFCCLAAACQGFERVAPALDAAAPSDASTDTQRADLFCSACEPQALADGLLHAGALALDETHVYWADTGDLTSPASLWRVPKVGCAGGVQCAEPIASDRFAITAFRVADGHVFWSERFDAAGQTDTGSIWRLALETREIVPLATTEDQPLDLLFFEGALYWSSATELRRRDAWQQTASVEVLQRQLARPLALAISQGRIFFTNLGSDTVAGYVASTRLDGSDWQVVAANQAYPVAIAVGPLYVYWADRTRGVVMRAQSDGQGLVSAFVSNLARPSALLIHDGTLYLSEEGAPDTSHTGRISAVRLDGTGRVTLAEGQAEPAALAIDGDALYWVNYGTSIPRGHDGAVMRRALH